MITTRHSAAVVCPLCFSLPVIIVHVLIRYIKSETLVLLFSQLQQQLLILLLLLHIAAAAAFLLILFPWSKACSFFFSPPPSLPYYTLCKWLIKSNLCEYYMSLWKPFCLFVYRRLRFTPVSCQIPHHSLPTFSYSCSYTFVSNFPKMSLIITVAAVIRNCWQSCSLTVVHCDWKHSFKMNIGVFVLLVSLCEWVCVAWTLLGLLKLVNPSWLLVSISSYILLLLKEASNPLE